MQVAENERETTVYCSECKHQVVPDTARGASMVAGTVVTVDRCPGCEAVLAARS
jgi:hypothetical protein